MEDGGTSEVAAGGASVMRDAMVVALPKERVREEQQYEYVR